MVLMETSSATTHENQKKSHFLGSIHIFENYTGQTQKSI